MSLYENRSKIKINGVTCGLVMRGAVNGRYLAVFEREHASLEDIEAIDWSQPAVEGDTILPAGYGFTVEQIEYTMGARSYTVHLQVAEQYLGDVAGYQSQVAELQGTVSQQAETIQSQQSTIDSQAAAIEELEAAGSAAQVAEALQAAYTEGVESNG